MIVLGYLWVNLENSREQRSNLIERLLMRILE